MIKYLFNIAQQMNLQLKDQQLNSFQHYNELLSQWNKKINLTSISDEKEIIIKHFIDSLTCCKVIDHFVAVNNDNKSVESFDNRMKLLDIGSGAGLPGIPLKIYYPDFEVVLLDSLNKRINFLQTVIGELEMDNISAVHARAEDLVKVAGNRESFSIVVSRAVAKLNVLTEYALPYLRVGGIFIAMKGPDYSSELKNAENSVCILGGKIKTVEKLILPEIKNERNLIVVEKIKATPRKYPRKPGMIDKNPL